MSLEIALNSFPSLASTAFFFKKNYFVTSVKALFVEFTCSVHCARQEHVALSDFCQVSQVTVLHYRSMFIYCCLYLHWTALPVLRSLWRTHVFATYVRLPRFAQPYHTTYEGCSGQLPWALWGLEYILLSQEHFKRLTAVWSLTLTAYSLNHAGCPGQHAACLQVVLHLLTAAEA